MVQQQAQWGINLLRRHAWPPGAPSSVPTSHSSNISRPPFSLYNNGMVFQSMSFISPWLPGNNTTGGGNIAEGCMVSCVQPWWLQGSLPFLPEWSRSSPGHRGPLEFHWGCTPLIRYSLALKCPSPELSIFSISFCTTYLLPPLHSAPHITLYNFAPEQTKQLSVKLK